MRLVYSSQNTMLVAHVRNLLQYRGIEAEMRNELAAGAAGELPPTDTWPEVWVPEEQYEEADNLVRTALFAEEVDAANWVCPRCGAENEGQFGQCWQCGGLCPDCETE